MRVIAGSARGRRLLAPKGLDTRPTTDRLKETLFNMLTPGLQGVAFLDVFSGTGAIGIEALSRGAASAVFIEKHKNAADTIRKNLQLTGFEEHSIVLQMDFISGLKKLGGDGCCYDIVFIDAPYGRDMTRQAIFCIAEQRLLADGGRIVAEIAADEEEPLVSGFSVIRTKKSAATSFVFMEADG